MPLVYDSKIEKIEKIEFYALSYLIGIPNWCINALPPTPKTQKGEFNVH